MSWWGRLRRKDDSMKRQVFFSFHFGNDVWRVGQIRNIGTIEGQELFSDNGWEKVRLKSDSAIKAWINKMYLDYKKGLKNQYKILQN